MNIPVFWGVTSHALVKFINTSQEYNASVLMAATLNTAVSNLYHIHTYIHTLPKARTNNGHPERNYEF